jgi:hypothetical protein
VSDDTIRAVFIANGFEIKPGYNDLKPYVYAAARALLAHAAEAQEDEIQRLQQALIDASEALKDADEHIRYYGPNPYQKGWDDDAEQMRVAAEKAAAAAMSGSEQA